MFRRLAVSSLCSALLLLGAQGAQAESFQRLNRDQGFQPERMQLTGEIDTINTFNGNLLIPIPLGQRYPLGEGFDYGLQVVYNSNLWDHETINPPFIPPPEPVSRTYPLRSFNAGLGWMVSLGRMFFEHDTPLPGCIPSLTCGLPDYREPDGTVHTFSPRLHPEDPEVSGFWYTTDGSYLRLRVLPGAAWRLEFPDGKVHEFNAAGMPTLITDQYGIANPTDPARNRVVITYETDAASGQPIWRLVDQHNRTQKVFFRSSVGGSQVVDKVELSAFGSLQPTTYRFLYDESRTIPRGCPHNEPAPIGTGYPGQVGPTVAVALLSSICVREDEANASSTSTCITINPATDYDLGVGTANVCTTGTLKRLALPTGGKLEWDYGDYIFPDRTAVCNGQRERGDVYTTNSVGVRARRLIDVNGNPLGSWTYQSVRDTFHPACGVDTSLYPREVVTQVKDLLSGSETDYYFSISVDETLGYKIGEYGAPMSRKSSVVDGGVTLFLSEEVKDLGGMVKRKVFREFEWDGMNEPFAENWNRRVRYERTFYEDQNRYADTTFDQFDGLGHYRRVTTGGNFGGGGSSFDATAENGRQTTTNFNPAMGTYPGAYTSWPTSREWVLSNYTDTVAIQDTSSAPGISGPTSKTIHCFESTTGRLMWKRTLVGASNQGGTDLLVRYTHDSAGNALTESFYGGDLRPVATAGTSASCSLSLPAPVYQINNTFQYGVKATSQFQGSGVLSLNQTIDQKTGLPSQIKDTAELASSITYDNLGRLKTVDTPGKVSSRYTYFPAIGMSQKARVDINYVNPSDNSALAFERVRWDAFGRIYANDRRMPDNSLSSKVFKYNGYGWKVYESEQGSTTQGTTFTNFDPFGRPARIIPADGAAHEIEFWLAGEKDNTRITRVALAPSGAEADVRISESYNRQGRLWRVTEDDGTDPDDTRLRTDYTYDVGGRLAQVTMARGGSGTQNRYFCYDNRGFLLKENLPERAANGNCTLTFNGSVRQQDFDELGNVGRRIEGVNDLRNVYDLAGRLIEVRRISDNNVLKRFTYGTGTTPSDRSKGRIKIAERFNDIILGVGTANPVPYTVIVRETYEYGGSAGQISSKTTDVEIGGQLRDRFVQTYQYDLLGNVTQIGYPDRCSTCSPQQGGSAPRTVSFGYTNGFLTQVPGFAGSISYHKSGLTASVAHSNGVTYTIDADPNGLARPAAIRTSGVVNGPVWDSGAYSYDGAGNVKAIGGSSFRYDAFGRLAFASLATGISGLGGNVTQQYTYDSFGNLTQLAGSSPTFSLSVPADPVTNRLAGGVYDDAGNLRQWSNHTYEVDAFNQIWRVRLGNAQEWIHIYTADDERLFSYLLEGTSAGGTTTRYTLRDLDGKVLRQITYDRVAGTFTFDSDYIYRGDRLLAAQTPGLRYHYHPDHLGTPRQITGSGGIFVSYHQYLPYGQELTDPNQDAERMKFTGHERDFHVPGSGDELDYMHARYYNPLLGRFLRVDPLAASGEALRPQSWNRFGYAGRNPMNLVDPDGRQELSVYLQGRAALPVGGEGSVGLVLNHENVEKSGAFVGGGPAVGLEVSGSINVGYAHRPAEGKVVNLNQGVLVVGGTVSFDDKGYQAFSLGLSVSPLPVPIQTSISNVETKTFTIEGSLDKLAQKASELKNRLFAPFFRRLSTPPSE